MGEPVLKRVGRTSVETRLASQYQVSLGKPMLRVVGRVSAKGRWASQTSPPTRTREVEADKIGRKQGLGDQPAFPGSKRDFNEVQSTLGINSSLEDRPSSRV